MLKTTHIFSFARILKTLGIKDELQNYMNEFDGTKVKSQKEVGLDILFTIFDKATTEEGENALIDFVSEMSGKPSEELKEMEATEFLNTVLEVANVEEWKAFFSSVAKLLKSN